MVIGLRRFVAGGLFAVTGLIVGCAQDVEAEDSVDPAGLDAIDTETITPAGATINCGGTIPGLPAPRCVPDLVFGPETAVDVVLPGQGPTPGTHVMFAIKNASPKAAGPFKVKVTDQYGATVKTSSYSGMAGYGSSMISFVAPYICGWSRTVTLDAENAIDEDSEANNTKTYAEPCPRL